MARDFARKFYNGKEWKKCRAAYIKLKHGLCERCSRPGYIVHHKKYLTPHNINNPNITLAFENLEYLCLECHNLEHMGTSVVRHDVRFDSEGNMISK